MNLNKNMTYWIFSPEMLTSSIPTFEFINQKHSNLQNLDSSPEVEDITTRQKLWRMGYLWELPMIVASFLGLDHEEKPTAPILLSHHWRNKLLRLLLAFSREQRFTHGEDQLLCKVTCRIADKTVTMKIKKHIQFTRTQIEYKWSDS